MGFFNRIFKHQPNASLDSVSFDVARYRYEGEANGHRVWFTPDGDGIGLFFFPKPPDLPSNAHTSAELQEFYRGRVGNDKVKIIEFGLPSVADIRCIWMVLKIPREPHGMMYVGSLTIPFAEFSFVLKIQCEEQGITGIRETALFIKAKQEGAVTFAADGTLAGDWNPDDPSHDAKFPDHPLSRLRREFACIMATLQVKDITKYEKRFELPT